MLSFLAVVTLLESCVVTASSSISVSAFADAGEIASLSDCHNDPSLNVFFLSSSSSGVPSRQAHASTYRNTFRFQMRFIMNNRTGTKRMMMIGKAGPPLVKVTMKMMTVRIICVAV